MKKTVSIRPIMMEDYRFILNWSKDDDFCLANGWQRNRTNEELFSWWEQCVVNKIENFHRLGIELDARLIGYVDLAVVKDKVAELGIAIGESNLWGKGIGSTAILQTIKYASENLAIAHFTAETHEANFRAQNMLAKLGFLEISRIGLEEYQGNKSQLIQYKFLR